MTVTDKWDSSFLRDRDRDARDAAMKPMLTQDWQEAIAEVERIYAESGRYPGKCPVASCRRARRCTHPERPCKALYRVLLNEREDMELIEDAYANIQIARRNAARADR